MDLRHLRYFIAVAEELHFTRAARRLHIAQPPLSRQIRELEAELDVTLFNRTMRQVELTDAGQVFLVKARQVLRAAESAVLETQRAERGETGKLAVGFFEQTAYTLLPPILRAFNQRFPEVDVQLRWFPVIGQVEALEQGEVDIAFVRPVGDLSAVSKRLLLTEAFVVAVPASHRFATRDAVSIEECADERIINYTQHLAPDYHAAIMRACALAGFVPKRPLDVGQVYTALGLVSAGVGITFAPASVQRVRFDGLLYKPLRGRPLESVTYLAWLQPAPSILLKAFVETAMRVMGETAVMCNTKP
jgi:DNA-binding transcriptional LysR family regulator